MKKAENADHGDPQRLPEGLNQRLTAYALAATAAGLGLTGTATPALADGITAYKPSPPFTVAPVYPHSYPCVRCNMVFSSGGKKLLGFYAFLSISSVARALSIEKLSPSNALVETNGLLRAEQCFSLKRRSLSEEKL